MGLDAEKTVAEISDETGIDYQTLRSRLLRGMSAEDAVKTPIRDAGRRSHAHGSRNA